MNALLADVRSALRHLAKSPMLSAVGVLSLALGLGVNITAFSVLRGISHPNFPYREPERLVAVSETYPPFGWTAVELAYPTYLDLKASSSAFEDMAAAVERPVALAVGETAVRARASVVSPNALQLVGTPPFMGRTFRPEDAVTGAAPVVVLAYGVWRSRFGADPGLLGRGVRVDGVERTVVGVMPQNFAFPETAELWLPVNEPRAIAAGRTARAYAVIGRLRASATIENARAEVAAVAARLAQEHPEANRGWGAEAVSLIDEPLLRTGRLFGLLQAVAVLVLVIVCANLGNVLLARAEARHAELAIRAALGGSRWALVRLAGVETAMLTGLGLAGGLWLAAVLIPRVPLLIPDQLPFFLSFRIDVGVLLFSLAAALGTALVMGVVPALRSAAEHPHTVLTGAARGATSGARTGRLRSAFLLGQAALATVLLSAALTLTLASGRLRRADTGFDPSPTLALPLDMAGPRYSAPDSMLGYASRVLLDASTLPDVAAASLDGAIDLAPGPGGVGAVEADRAPTTSAGNLVPSAQVVSEHYFTALGIPMLHGRGFVAGDRRGGEPVVVVNARAATLLFGAPDRAVGRRVRFARAESTPEWHTVVGVATDTRLQPLDPEFEPRLYVAFAQEPTRPATLTVRMTRPSPALALEVAAAVARIDPDQVVDAPLTGDARVARGLWQVRFTGAIVSLLALFALGLTAVGLFGVAQFLVGRRIRELGVRRALGANTIQVARLIARQGGTPVLIGVGLGLAAAAGISTVLSRIVYGTPPVDGVALAGSALTLVSAGVLALVSPVRRALRIEPIEALKSD